MGHIIIKLVSFSILILVIVSIVRGITIDAFGVGLVFSIIIATLNLLIKPLIDYKGHPFNNVVLGVSAIFVNIILFYVADVLLYQITMETFLSVFVSAFLIGVGEMMISSLVDKHKYSR